MKEHEVTFRFNTPIEFFTSHYLEMDMQVSDYRILWNQVAEQFHIKKTKRHRSTPLNRIFCHPATSAQCDKIKNATHSRRCISKSVCVEGGAEQRGEWKVRKPQRTGSPVTDVSLHFHWSPPGNWLGIQVRACQQHVRNRELWLVSRRCVRLCVMVLSFSFTSWSTSHLSRGVKVHTSLNLVHPLWPSHVGLG